ncbi:MAG: hypothetical protein ACOYOK_12145 [Pseudobdellovibrionaceae bacterium]
MQIQFYTIPPLGGGQSSGLETLRGFPKNKGVPAKSIFFLSLLSTVAVYAALPQQWIKGKFTEAQHFYKSPQSLFFSGQASAEVLEKNQLRTQFQFQYQIQWNKKLYWLPSTSLVRDIQLSYQAKTNQSVILLEQKMPTAKALALLPLETSVLIENTDDYWALVKVPQLNKTGYIPLHLLKALEEDPGRALTVSESFLKQNNNYESKNLLRLPAQARLKILDYNTPFLKVEYKNADHLIQGYIDINHIICKMDFANQVFYNGKWLETLYRENEFLITKDKQKISIAQIVKSKMDERRSFSLQTFLDGPILKSKLEIKSVNADLWAQSRLPLHGEVWWKKQNRSHFTLQDDLNKSLLLNNETSFISNETLLKRDIFSVSFSKVNKMLGLVSARGIYTTNDGKTWQHLQNFGNKNWPVAIHPNGAWLVGTFISNDQGQSFEPYIRWDKLTDSIVSVLKRQPRSIKIESIEPLPQNQVRLRIETGYHTVFLQSQLGLQDWKVSP